MMNTALGDFSSFHLRLLLLDFGLCNNEKGHKLNPLLEVDHEYPYILFGLDLTSKY